MKRKLLSLILTGAMVLSLAACGGTGNNGGGATGGGDTNPPSQTADEKIEDVTITLDMWCIATESDSNRHSYEAAIADMTEKYPNITLNWEAFENQSYKTKIKAAVQANEMPDIFFTWLQKALCWTPGLSSSIDAGSNYRRWMSIFSAC